ncbi:hypothetical protein EK904_002501 [Melospiza melodia maxima]|nr:hypothetical protein EK904_002501 [Melospiza melodia maxima]
MICLFKCVFVQNSLPDRLTGISQLKQEELGSVLFKYKRVWMMHMSFSEIAVVYGWKKQKLFSCFCCYEVIISYLDFGLEIVLVPIKLLMKLQLVQTNAGREERIIGAENRVLLGCVGVNYRGAFQSKCSETGHHPCLFLVHFSFFHYHRFHGFMAAKQLRRYFTPLPLGNPAGLVKVVLEAVIYVVPKGMAEEKDLRLSLQTSSHIQFETLSCCNHIYMHSGFESVCQESPAKVYNKQWAVFFPEKLALVATCAASELQLFSELLQPPCCWISLTMVGGAFSQQTIEKLPVVTLGSETFVWLPRQLPWWNWAGAHGDELWIGNVPRYPLENFNFGAGCCDVANCDGIGFYLGVD